MNNLNKIINIPSDNSKSSSAIFALTSKGKLRGSIFFLFNNCKKVVEKALVLSKSFKS